MNIQEQRQIEARIRDKRRNEDKESKILALSKVTEYTIEELRTWPVDKVNASYAVRVTIPNLAGYSTKEVMDFNKKLV